MAVLFIHILCDLTPQRSSAELVEVKANASANNVLIQHDGDQRSLYFVNTAVRLTQKPCEA